MQNSVPLPSGTSSHILLTLPNVSLHTLTASASAASTPPTITGTLALECISSPPTHRTLDAPNAPNSTATNGTDKARGESDEREAYVVLHVMGVQVPLDPGAGVRVGVDADGRRVYVLKPSGGLRGQTSYADTKKAAYGDLEKIKDGGVGNGQEEVMITVAEYTDDVGVLDGVLAQYADVSEYVLHARSVDTTPPPPSYQHAIATTSGPEPVDADPISHTDTHTSTGVQGLHIDDPALRGRLVLMDTSNGEVVGELPERLSFREDPALRADDKGYSQMPAQDAGPVVLELPQDVYEAYTREGGMLESGRLGEELIETREVFVRAIPPEEQDWVTKGATVVSHAISSSTSLLLSGITTASSYYIKNSAAYTPPPPHPSSSTSTSSSSIPRAKTPTPHPALTQAHFISTKAAKASAVTATYVEKFIRAAVGGKDTDTDTASSRPSSPPINTTYNVYRPKPRSTRSGSASPGMLSASPVSMSAPSTPPPPPPKKPLRTRDRVLMSANLVLATVDDSAKRMFDVSSERLGAVIGHKYGPQAQQSTHLATHTARNVVLVYVDVSGFARRALITTAGKEYVKARMGARRALSEEAERSVVVSSPSPPPPPRV